MRISLVVNCDTRPARDNAGAMLDGVASRDFLIEGLRNKKKFLDGFDVETILWVDEHEPISSDLYNELHQICDRLVISKHSKKYRNIDNFQPFNDINYLQALSLARGEIICHFDQDMAAFVRGPEYISSMIDTLMSRKYKYICYPSTDSPKCVNDPRFGRHMWASTRFFMCLKTTFDATELENAIWNPDTLYVKYGRPDSVNDWTEHFLGVAAGGENVFYPPVSNHFLVFPWFKYKDGVLGKLNQMDFDSIYMKLIAAGAHTYHGCEADRLILP